MKVRAYKKIVGSYYIRTLFIKDWTALLGSLVFFFALLEHLFIFILTKNIYSDII